MYKNWTIIFISFCSFPTLTCALIGNPNKTAIIALGHSFGSLSPNHRPSMLLKWWIRFRPPKKCCIHYIVILILCKLALLFAATTLKLVHIFFNLKHKVRYSWLLNLNMRSAIWCEGLMYEKHETISNKNNKLKC